MVFFLVVVVVVGFICSTESTRDNQEPYFTNVKSWQMEENQPIGSRPRSAIYPNSPVILTAYDADGDPLEFGVKGDPESSYFTVDSKTGVVKLRTPFDREVVSHCVTRFSVSDAFNEFVEEVEIEILDVNDNPPLFEQIRYNVTIPEDAAIGSEILRLVTTDPDLGSGGWVTYELSEQDVDSPFRLDADSGSLYLRLNIDFEMTMSYRLLVSARDQDTDNPLSSTAVVTINIDDVQDTGPVFEGLPYDVSIDENTAYRTRILTVAAVDGDRGQPHPIEFSLRSGNEAGKFLLESRTGDIRVMKPIDRDTPGFNGVYRLTVRAWERIENQLAAFSDVSFNVTIKDVNDERPRFEKSRHQLVLSENHPVGTSLPLTLHVTDNDLGVNSDVTMSVDWRNRDVITVTPVSFRGYANVTMILTKPFDFETDRRHFIKIFANESGSSKLYSSCEVRLGIQNENDNSPVFEHSHYKIDVFEDAPLVTPVIRVHAVDGDAGKFGLVVYSLEGDGGAEINRTTGDVFLTQQLDYEETRMLQYVVIAQDSADEPLSSKALLSIKVLDVNDNLPVLPNKLPEVFISENVKGEVIAEIKATDADSPPFDVITYVIDDGPISSHFAMNKSKDGFGLLVIEAPLVVHVIDENDNTPIFVGSLNFTVKESIGDGARVGTLRAVDRDSGDNGLVDYYVTEGRKSFESVFELNERSGDITTKLGASPDYEVVSIYDIRVVAKDNGNPRLSTSQWARIKVEDINDNAPVFESSDYRALVEENSDLRGVRVRASDHDAGDNGRVRYAITESSIDGLFRIDDVTGDITATREIDYEDTGGSLKLKIQAQDQGREISLSSFVEAFITILDLNDNPPIFRPPRTSNPVMENVRGPSVGVFWADDADSKENGKIIYSIASGNELNRFAISPLEGELRVRPGIELDREDQEFYNLTICATDTGSVPLQDTLRIRIQVLDVNDNSPVFIRLPERITVEENRIQRGVLRLDAVDPDAGESGVVTFAIEGGDGALVIDARSGVVDLIKPLDREVVSELLVHVTASDNPSNARDSRSTTKQLVIQILDDNDEKPLFRGPSPYRATIEEEAASGTALDFTTDPISASDADEGSNAEVTYSIIGDSPYFAIDETSGVISTITKIDREMLTSDVIELVVRASDVGGLFSETLVLVTVYDVNDNDPRFQQSKMSCLILECAQPGHVTARVTATDPDQGSNGEVTYRIKSGSYDKFAINPQTGVIYLAPGQYLDREEKSTYRLKIIASDLAPVVPRSITGEVMIKVEDVNDSRPKFVRTQQRVEVPENSKVGKEMVRVRAVDDDVNPDLFYFMTTVTIYGADGRPLVVDGDVSAVMQSNNDVVMNWIHLNSTSGVISLASKDADALTTIDRELCSAFIVSIMVRDRASIRDELSKASQPITVQFDVIDENDNAPNIKILTNDVTVTKNEVVVDVEEEVDVMTSLFSVAGFDPDQGSSGEVVFQLDNHLEAVLGLDTDNPGTIVSTSRLDRESLAPSGGSAWLNFTLVSRDLDYFAPLSSKLLVRMRIKDINDNAPTFSQGFYEVSLFEDSEVGSLVMQLRASDVDDGDFGDVIYRLYGAMNYFEIDPQNGEITLSKSLDYETRREHVFTVIARDSPRGDGGAHESSVQITVTVGDVNDNAPVFIQPLQTSLRVFENSARGSLITMVTATDADDGEYGNLIYTVTSQTDFFQIDPYNGDLTVTRRITVSQFSPVVDNMIIIATDGGGVETELHLQITLVDINDHVPRFNQPENSVVTIEEEKLGGLFVVQVDASDDDLGLNGMVTYKLRDTGFIDDAFHIDDVTGRIVTTRKLDRESRSSYSVIVEASDLGSPPMQSTMMITIRLLDVNDNKPAFPQREGQGAFQSLSVDENVQSGFLIGQLMSAMDRDENATIFYHIVSEDGAMVVETFRIKGNQVFLLKQLDREVKDRYSLLVEASNDEKLTTTSDKILLDPSRLGEATDPASDPSLLRLSINVRDVIDDAPRFLRHSYVTPVETETAPGTQVVTVSADDNDINDLMTYSIKQATLYHPSSDNTSSMTNAFVINPKTGVVTTVQRLTNKLGSRYLLLVQVNDLRNLSDEATLELKVLRRSHLIQIVVESPPHVVKEKGKELTKILENVTGSVVKIDDVTRYMTSHDQSDVVRSEISVRVFDAESSKEEILGRLKRSSKKLQQLFKTYFSYESRNPFASDNDVIMLRAIVFVLSVLFVLLTIIFVASFSHLKRRHKKEIEKLKASSNDGESITSEKTFWMPSNSKFCSRSENDSHARESLVNSCPSYVVASLDKMLRDYYLCLVDSDKQQIKEARKEYKLNWWRKNTASPETVECFRVDDVVPSQELERRNSSTTADSLLWSPTLSRNEAKSSGTVARQETFHYQMPLHATTDDKLPSCLHGSDSVSSF